MTSVEANRENTKANSRELFKQRVVYSLDEHISAHIWVGFRKSQTCMYIASIFHSTLNCTLNLSIV